MGHIIYKCGQCPYCLGIRKKIWMTRIKLEQLLHETSIFITLTYDPKKYSGESLEKRHTQLFWKSYRQSVSPRKLRYYLCGEYGEISGRPHYHAIVFGGRVDDEAVVQASWDYGFVQVGDISDGGIDYVTKYVQKGMHRNKTQKQKSYLKERTPEFCLTSRRPGIGVGVLEQIAQSCIASDNICLGIDKQGDVPNSVSIKNKKSNIGRFLTGKLRLEFGHGDTKAKTDWKAASLQRLSDFIGLSSLTPQERLSLKGSDIKKLYYDQLENINEDQFRKGKKL